MIRKPLIMSFLSLGTEALTFLDTTKREQKHSEIPAPQQAEKWMPHPNTDPLPKRWARDFRIPPPRTHPSINHLGWGLDPQGSTPEALKPNGKSRADADVNK